jgi:amino acid transporter
VSPSHAIPGPRTPADEDRDLEQRFGIAPVLSRRMGRFAAITGPFNIISVPTGLLATASLAMGSGGPAGWWWAWALVSVFTMVVGVAISELASGVPTAAALYQFTHLLARPERAGRDSHRVGWLNFFGLSGGVASVAYGGAVSLQYLITMQWPHYTTTPERTLLWGAGLMLLYGLINTLDIGKVALVNQAAAWWILGGIVLIVAVLAVVPAHHQSAGWVFFHTVNNTGFNASWGPSFGIVLAGGSALYTFSGYDISAHTAEETLGASRTVPAAITRAIAVSAVCGAVMIAALMFAAVDFTGESGASSPVAQIFLDALGPTWAKALLAVCLIIQMFCGVAVVTAASRQWFAFCGRNNSMVGSGLWARVSLRTRVPVASVWFSVAFGILLTLPGWIWNATVLNAVVTINFVGLLTAYGVPIYLRLRYPQRFTPGPWHRRHSVWYARIALVWIVIGTLIGVAPQLSPITVKNLNYAGPALAALLVLEQVLWLWRGRSYTPPASTISAAQAAGFQDEMV